MIRIGRLSLALPLFLLLVSGCNTSNTPASASGKITYKGQTVSTGSLQFHTAEGSKGMYSYAFSDGAYSASDLPVGEYVVTIETESANPDAAKRNAVQPGGRGKPDQAGDYQKQMMERGAIPNTPGNKGPYVKIPPKYADEKTTTLKAKLTKGSNTVNFDLTD
jgi:hypothetical protein